MVTHRSAATIADTIVSLRALPLQQVVVVDNDSPDETVTVVERNLPAGGVLVRARNAGFGAGNNRGAAAATKPWDAVLFLNPDATVEAADFVRLTEHLDAHPTVGMVGAAMWRRGEPQRSGGRDATVLTEWRRELPRWLAWWLPNRPLPPGALSTGPVAYVEGACMLVRRAAFEAVQGFDEGFFLFFEELDLGRRLRAAGWDVHLVADARVEHVIAGSRASVPLQGEPHFAASTYRYLAKWQGRRRAEIWRRGVETIWRAKVLAGRMSSVDRAALTAAVREQRRRWA